MISSIFSMICHSYRDTPCLPRARVAYQIITRPGLATMKVEDRQQVNLVRTGKDCVERSEVVGLPAPRKGDERQIIHCRASQLEASLEVAL